VGGVREKLLRFGSGIRRILGGVGDRGADGTALPLRSRGAERAAEAVASLGDDVPDVVPVILPVLAGHVHLVHADDALGGASVDRSEVPRAPRAANEPDVQQVRRILIATVLRATRDLRDGVEP